MTGDSAQILFQCVLQVDHYERLWPWQGCPLSDVVHPAFCPLTMALSALHGALKDVFFFKRLPWCTTCPNHANFCLLTLPEELPVDPHGN